MYYQSDSTQLKDIQNKHGSVKLKNFPITNILWHKVYLPYVRNIKQIRLLDFMPYFKEEATDFLVEHFDFKNIHKNILSLDLLGFMKVIGFLKSLDLIQEKFNSRA